MIRYLLQHTVLAVQLQQVVEQALYNDPHLLLGEHGYLFEQLVERHDRSTFFLWLRLFAEVHSARLIHFDHLLQDDLI